MGEAYRPATLADCPPELRANFTINTNGGTGQMWRRFCYRGGEERFSRHLKRKKIPSLKGVRQ